ncbi:hypothetical protein BX616_001728 [Lobosporangium transversale]|uniref:Ceramide glucosyltransferase n=1 Tax=Lobosporangium transversale TaxID=64571 RepID=A0A1Y2G9Q3_9FUNG|nr:glycosyl transferase family 21-domain-containing protein [Lobosporangium transversale]KAF9903060.1 hypothetical protein BX616_001728 [Lobosporangium transversale]ORY96018.1 glycosyl transferase family 21-domain-containing protein [Lobosporangium transversale]|eukprot:XP_021875455.1 glycosyl transferase family 21-domain-containing protein [Lobosporangium transversale]
MIQSFPSVWERYSNLQLFCMVLSLLVWLFSCIAAVVAITLSRSRYGRFKPSLSSQMSVDEAPGVSIIRPLRGVDCNMYKNLASSFEQDYPCFEIIFSVANPGDPAITAVEALMKQYPKVDARLIIGEEIVGMNPKVNNMIRSYETAKYDIVWICDSNVYVGPGCMGRSVDMMMRPDVGLVHHLPYGVRPQTLGSELELMFLNTVHAKMYLFINWTRLASCVVGKSNLFRRSDLNKVGGLAAFGRYMAEDNMLATAIFKMGYKHEMTGDLAYQSLGSISPSDYFLRRARWTRIRKYMVTVSTFLEPLTEMIGCGLIASYGFNMLWNIHVLNFLAFHIVTWFLVDLTIYQALSGEKMDNLRGFLMAWCGRELAALPLFAYAVAGSTVDWRDQTFMLYSDGTVKPIEPTPHLTKGPKTRRMQKNLLPSPLLNVASASSPTAAASWTNTMVSPSAQASLGRFFRHPAVISVVSTTFAIIHFVVDILIKSQRNGINDDDSTYIEDHTLHEDMTSNAIFEKEGSLGPQAVTLKHRLNKGNSSYSNKKSNKRFAFDYDGDNSSAAKNEINFRRAHLKVSDHSNEAGYVNVSLNHKVQKNGFESEDDIVRRAIAGQYPSINDKYETETEYGHRASEEDELSKAVEPYLSDSLSRRAQTMRRELPSASHFLSVVS